ncbi:hypothetical protein Q7C18_02925 [Nesterenkonia sp. CL21]|uniref:hypothetical protein n=1 Tax=Nesterenkonia sp. CL21 TaxID=3064894 RepID=UPI0028785C38|nr:hypothetical protein [Nesterenkonia sp. CL21]MDS2171641.1 hypothetical protein [Nesterenkonia sp. CL21]
MSLRNELHEAIVEIARNAAPGPGKPDEIAPKVLDLLELKEQDSWLTDHDATQIKVKATEWVAAAMHYTSVGMRGEHASTDEKADAAMKLEHSRSVFHQRVGLAQKKEA